MFVNGKWIGMIEDPQDLILIMRNMRREIRIPKEVSIVRDIPNKELRFYSDAGRVQRPLFIVESNKLRLNMGHVHRLQKKKTESNFMRFDATL